MNRILILFLLCYTGSLVYGQELRMIDLNESSINWEGSDVLGLNRHTGTVKFRYGTVKKQDNILQGGSFEIDMNSIRTVDGNFSNKLIAHLKNEDFFDVKKYPITKLEIIHVHYLNLIDIDIIAYLTINSIRKIIKIPATVEKVKDEFVVKSKFAIDRRLWKIHHSSKGVYENVRYNIISDDILFDVIMVTNANAKGC